MHTNVEHRHLRRLRGEFAGTIPIVSRGFEFDRDSRGDVILKRPVVGRRYSDIPEPGIYTESMRVADEERIRLYRRDHQKSR